MTVPPTPARSRAGRAGAALSLLSATLHAVHENHCATVWLVVAPTLMALGCLWCAWHLWTRPAPRAWATTAAMSAAMLVLHTAVPMSGALPRAATAAALADLLLATGMLLGATGATARAVRWGS